MVRRASMATGIDSGHFMAEENPAGDPRRASAVPAPMRIDRQQAFSGTTAADIPAAALCDLPLATASMASQDRWTIARFKGGQSNPTYALDTPRRHYVLRRKPFGKLLPSAHAIEREYRVTDALAPRRVSGGAAASSLYG